MKHTKLLVVALLVALLACLAMSASADEITHGYWLPNTEQSVEATCYRPGKLAEDYMEWNADTKSFVKVGYRETTIPTTAHTWGDWVVVVEPSCTHPGESYRRCDVCYAHGIVNYDKSTVRYYPEQLDHGCEMISKKIAATCTEVGYNQLDRCPTCGKVDPKGLGNDGSKIAATGHKFDTSKWEVTQEATCNKEGKAERQCLNYDRDGKQCTATDSMTVPKSPIHRDWDKDTKKITLVDGYSDDGKAHDLPWKLVTPAKPAYCVTPGCKAVYQCPVCGAQIGGESTPALGHKVNNTWTVQKEATCANEGKAARLCDRPIDIYGNKCGYVLESTTTPKASSHFTYDKNPGGTKVTTKLPGSDYKNWGNTYEEYKTKAGGEDDPIWAFITPAKPAKCDEPGCTAIFRCKICGKTIGGEKTAALGHNWKFADEEKATCLEDGYVKYHCDKCDTDKKVTVPATGHYAVWAPLDEKVYDDQTFTVWVLHCTNPNCDLGGAPLATQVVKKGETAPTGIVATGASRNASTTTTTTTGDAPKTTTTTTPVSTTAKSTTKTSTTKSTASTASTKTAAAAPAAAAAAPAAKKVATVAAVKAVPAVELEPNQAQLVADKHLYVVKNVAGEEIVLTVNIVDGKITVEANLAEGESLVLYANAEAIENPTAENTLVLTANEAVELPEAFQNAIVAVVKTESLPTALAAK